MSRIIKTQDFVSRNYYYLFGGFWMLLGIFSYWVEGLPHYLYFPVGLAAVVCGYWKQKYHKWAEYISWDEENLRFRELAQEWEFKLQDIEELYFSKTHVTIKAGTAKGSMIDITRYREEDLQKFRSFFYNRLGSNKKDETSH